MGDRPTNFLENCFNTDGYIVKRGGLKIFRKMAWDVLNKVFVVFNVP